MKTLFIFFFCFLIGLLHASEWRVGGELTVQFQSDVDFACSPKEIVALSAHLPGFQEEPLNGKPATLLIDHRYVKGEKIQLMQNDGKLQIQAPWIGTFPQDFIHLLYGACRREWLKAKIFPVHAACIGNESAGYVLLVGPPGSGKTSLTLNCTTNRDLKVFSGDKTLLRFCEDGSMEALSGTRTLTIRSEDRERWAAAAKINETIFGDRLAFQLHPEHYTEAKSVKIKQIYMISLNDGAFVHSELAPLSALHTLYPIFLDKQREDTLIGGDQALFNGAVSSDLKHTLQQNLSLALQYIPVYKVTGSLRELTSFISKKETMTPKKILFGVCGIGSGHYNRQAPLVRHFLDSGHQVMVFTYGEALSFFNEKFTTHPNLTVIPVRDPYYVGSVHGLEFEQTATSDKNSGDFMLINARAMHQAAQKMGQPDLVISDYEMVAAQYAYIKSAPLVTLDQQSKYLLTPNVEELSGTSPLDEIERLHLFFPKAAKRIAVSFFKVKATSGQDRVELLGPMIRPEILANKGAPLSQKPTILVYMTAQQLGNQPFDQWIQTIRDTLPKHFEAHIFLPKSHEMLRSEENLFFYHHGDRRFDTLLLGAHGIVTTAGHTLLSEAMYLEKPVYAIPLALYEQQLNADTIEKGGFGMARDNLTAEAFRTFLQNLELYRYHILHDQSYLIKEPGNSQVIQLLEAEL